MPDAAVAAISALTVAGLEAPEIVRLAAKGVFACREPEEWLSRAPLSTRGGIAISIKKRTASLL